MMNRHQRRQPSLNPFIVLSDVTISTLVIITCLLMIFSVATASVERDKEKRLQSISEKQRQLDDKVKSQEFQKQVDAIALNFGVSNATGDSTYLFRFFDPRMFERSKPSKLSDKGRQVLRLWARTVGSILRAQSSETGRNAITLIEIQIRGHCAASTEGAMRISLERAMDAAQVLTEVAHAQSDDASFPECLLSAAGLGAFRPAHKSTIELINAELTKNPKEDKKGVHTTLLSNGVKKPLLADRLDILLVYSGGERQNNFVQAVDAHGVRYGPKNDTSTEDIWQDP